MQAIGYSGENGEVCNCAKCGRVLWGDHGYRMSNGSAICVDGPKCNLRIVAKRVAEKKAAGWVPRWRKA